MSQDRTDASQGCTLAEHGRGGGMSQDMRTIDGCFDPSPTQRRAYDMGNSRSCEWVKRSEYGSEHLGHLQRRPALIHIEQNRVPDLLRQWERFLATTLSADADSTVAPVDIGEFQVERPRWRATQAGLKAEARLYLAIRKPGRRRSRSPARHPPRRGTGELMTAAMRQNRESHVPCPQGIAQSRRESGGRSGRRRRCSWHARSRAGAPVRARRHVKLRRNRRARLTKSIEESEKDSLIDVERRLSQSTVGAHPGTKFSQDGPSLSSGWLGYRRRKLALQLEESDE